MASMTGTTMRIMMSASVGLMTNSTTAMTTSVSPCTARLTSPSWNSVVSASMSLVMRVMSRPAFSSVKKSSDRRWKWEKTRTRSSYMSVSPSRPVKAMTP